MSNICTTLEESKKLMELGLNPLTADMAYQRVNRYDNLEPDLLMVNMSYQSDKPLENVEYTWELFPDEHPAIKLNSFSFRYGYVKPAWTLSRLLDLIPSFVLRAPETTDCGEYLCQSLHSDLCDVGIYGSTAMEAVYKMVVYLLEFGGFIKSVNK